MAKKKKTAKKVKEAAENVAQSEEQMAGNEIEGVGNEVDVKIKDQAEEQAASEDDAPLDEMSLLKAQLDAAHKDAIEWKDKHFRLMAEFDNFRKRTRRESESFREYASEETMSALLPVLDDFERTMSAMEKTDNLSSLKEGVTLVNGKLWNILDKKGLKVIDAMGSDFDLDLHEAIHSLPVEEEDKKGKVLDVVEKGYKLKDKVIRYAKVVVGE